MQTRTVATPQDDAGAAASSKGAALIGPTPERILCLLPRQLGDILLGTPLAQALRTKFPGAHISWYAHPMGKLVLDAHPWIDELLCYPLRRKDESWIALAWRELRFVWRLRRMRFDVVVDAMGNPRTALTSWLTGARLRVSFRTRFPRTLAFRELVPRGALAKGYVARARLELLRPLGIDPEASSAEALLPLREEEKARVENWLVEVGLASGEKSLASVQRAPALGRFVVVAPAHRHAVRKWPAEKFVELSRRLWMDHGVATVWLWGPGEEGEISALHTALQSQCQSALGRPADAAHPGAVGASHVPPLFNLRETAYLSGLSAAFIGNSNGLSHVAVAGGARSVQLHGPTSPENWTFPDDTRHAGVQRKTGCVGCNKNVCALARRECLDDLSVNDVLRAFLHVWQRPC